MFVQKKLSGAAANPRPLKRRTLDTVPRTFNCFTNTIIIDYNYHRRDDNDNNNNKNNIVITKNYDHAALFFFFFFFVRSEQLRSVNCSLCITI